MRHTDGPPRDSRSAGRRGITDAAALLKGARSIVLLGHVNPDADALGSALALGLGLESLGLLAAVSFPAPDSVPFSLRSLPGGHLIVRPADLPDDIDVLVTLDVGVRERLGGLAGLLDTAGTSIVIDHHSSNTRFGVHNIVDPSAEATVVLVAELLDVLNVALNADIAANLYAGLATDTVNFRHAGAATHRLAARLLDAGVRPAELMKPIMDTHPFGWFPMLSAVLGRARFDPRAASGGGLVHTSVTLADWNGLGPEEADSVIDILRTAAGASVAAVVKQTDGQTWQVSLRAQPGTDVAAVAVALGGGGHILAAGYTHFGDYDTAIAELIAALDR